MRFFQPTLIAATFFATGSFGAPAETLFSKVIAPDTVEIANPTVLTYTIDNAAITETRTGLAFSETLPANVAVSANPDLQTTCESGTFAATGGGSSISYSAGELAAGASCTLSVNVTPSTAGTFTLTSGDLTYTSGTVGTSTDELIVSAAAFSLSKTTDFSSLDIGATARSEVVFTGSGTNNFYTLTETLPDGLSIADPIRFAHTCTLSMSPTIAPDRKSFSVSHISFSGQTCGYSFDISADQAGTYLNAVTVSGNASARAAASIDVTGHDGAAPSIISAVANNPVAASGLAEFTYTILNPDRSDAASGLTFTADYNSLIAGATVESVSSAAPCGVGSTGTGSGTFTLAGGNIGAGERCSFSVNVRLPSSATPGNHSADTSTLTGTLGGAGFSSAGSTSNLAVTALAAVQLTASQSPSSAAPGETVAIRYDLTNPNASDALSNISFRDFSYIMATELPAFVVDTNTCGGSHAIQTPSSAYPTGHLLHSGAFLSAGASCVVILETTLADDFTFGTYTSPITEVQATGGGTALFGADASYDTTVTSVGNLALSKSFDVANAVPGELVGVNYTLRNRDEENSVSLVSFTDNLETFATGTTLNAIDTNSCGMTITDPSGTPSLVSFSAASLAPSEVCEIELTIQLGGTTGTFTGTTSEIAVNGTNIDGSEASAALSVSTTLPLTGFISFPEAADATFVVGADILVRFTVENPNASDATLSLTSAASSAFSGATFATTPVTNGCGGAATPSTSVNYSGGTVPAENVCYVEYMMQVPGGTSPGSSTLSASVVSDAGGATLNGGVTIRDDFLTASALFSPDSITTDEAFAFAVTLSNAYSDVASNVSFFLDATELATLSFIPSSVGCSPSYFAGAGSTLTVSNITIAAEGTCVVTLTSNGTPNASIGTFTMPVSTIQGDFEGITLSASDVSDTLTVNADDGPTLAMAFGADPYVSETLDVTYTLTNGGSANADMRFSHDFSSLGLGLTASSLPSTPCGAGSTITGTDTLLIENMTLAASEVCAFTVTLDVPLTATAGSYTSTTGNITISGATVAAGGSDSFEVLAVSPATFTATASPSTILQRDVTTVTYLIDGTASALGATGLGFTHFLPTGLDIASPANASTTCTGGTLNVVNSGAPLGAEAAAAGSYVSYSGGSVAANASCSVTVDMTSETVTTFSADTGPLTTSLGTVPTATLTLAVQAQTQGSVTIVQETNVDGTFNFASATSALDFSITTASGTGSQGPILVANGAHVVTQSVPATMSTSGITCDDADSTGDIATGVLTLNVDIYEHVTCTFTSGTSSSKATETISTFIAQRNTLILANQPSVGRRIGRLQRGTTAQRLAYSPGDVASLSPVTFDPKTYKSGNYDISTSLDQVTRAAETFALATGAVGDTNYHSTRRFDVWFEASYNKFEGSSDNGGSFGIYYLGADYLVNPDLLIGALVQYDRMDSASALDDYSIEGKGWMVGPYVTARLQENLYLDARFAWGKSENDISPFNTYTDRFTTQRRLINASLSGKFEVSDWTLQPNVELSYIEDRQKAYVDSLAVVVPSQTLSVGQLRFGPNASRQYVMSNGTVYEPRLTLDAIYSHERTVLAGVTTQDNYWRARLEAGLGIKTDDGLHMSINGNLDGLGQSDFKAWGVDFVLGYEF